MSIQGDVALFMDLENIRFGLLNTHHVEPDISALIDKARKYGRVVAALAYADFSEHPEWVRRQMDVAGITARDIPLRRLVREGIEHVKSSADIHMVMDVIETVLDRPNIETYILMTGDSDYIRTVTWLRNRFGKTVIIAGVPGTVSRELVAAAGGNDDPIDVPGGEVPMDEIVDGIVRMVHGGNPPAGYWSAKLIDQWANDPRNSVPGTGAQKRRAIGIMLEQGLLKQMYETRRGRQVKVVTLNKNHPTAQRAVAVRP